MASYFFLLFMFLAYTCVAVDVSFKMDAQTNCIGATSSDTCTMTCDSLATDRNYDCGNAGTCIIYCQIDKCLERSTIDATNSITLTVYSSSAECYKDVTVTSPNYGSAYFLPEPGLSSIDEKLFKKINIVSGTNTELIHINCANGINTEDCRQADVNARTANRLEITGTGVWSGDAGNTVQCPENSIYEQQASCVIDIATVTGTTFIVPNGIPDDIIITSNTMTGIIINCGSTVTRSGSMDSFMGTACWKTWNPTNNPTSVPTVVPTFMPTVNPTTNPTFIPTFVPTFIPTFIPTFNPVTAAPTNNPTHYTTNPTKLPTVNPTKYPSKYPTEQPTMAPSASPSAAPTRPAGSVGDGATTEIIDIDGNNQEANNKNTSGHMIYVYLGIAGAVMIMCCITVFVWKFKRNKAEADSLTKSVEMNRVNNNNNNTIYNNNNNNTNNTQIFATNSNNELLEYDQVAKNTNALNGNTLGADVIMGDVSDLMLTPMGPPQDQQLQNDNIITQGGIFIDDDDDIDNDIVIEGDDDTEENDDDDDVLIGVNNVNNTPMGNPINMDNNMIIEGDDDDDVLIGVNSTPMGNQNDDGDEINNVMINEGDDDDDVLIGVNNTPMGNQIDDGDEINNVMIDEGDDMDIINDVNGKVTKGYDDDMDINIDESDDNYEDEEDDDDDILQQMDTLQ